MHEWALAEAVLAAASEFADKECYRHVSDVRIRVGELQGIELEILDFAFSQLKKGKLKDAKFSMETVKAEFKCRVCGNSWAFSRDEVDEATVEAIHFVPEIAHTYIKCPKCGSSDFEVTEGRGVWLDNIKGER